MNDMPENNIRSRVCEANRPSEEKGPLPHTSNRLLTPREVAVRLGVSERWVRDHATRRYPRIAVIRLGPLLRFRPEDVAQFIAEQRDDNFQLKPRYR